MALININFYNYLKEAIAYKLNNPAAGFYRSSLYVYNLNYSEIFREAREIFPQKYSNSHYFLHNTSFPFLNDLEKNQLNMDFARDLAKGFGGLDVADLQNQNPDHELVSFENDVLRNSKFETLNETPKEQFTEQNPQEQEEPPPQQSGGQEESSGNQPTQRARNEPRRVIIQKPGKPQYGMTKEEYAKYKEEHKEDRDARARELWAQRKAARESSNQDEDEDEKKKRLRKPSENQPAGKNPLSNRINNWAKNKFNNSRFGKAFNNSRFGRGLTRINNFLDTPNRLLNKLGDRLANTNLGQGLTRINNLLNAPSRFLSRLGSQALRGALNLGSQAARFLINSAARALSNLASQAAGGAARAAVGTAGRGLVAGIAAIGVTGALIIVLVIVVALGIFWLYDSNSECGQPGVVEMTKSTNKDSYSVGERIDYKIQAVYKIKCNRAFAAGTVRDTLPANTTFVPNSAKSSASHSIGFLSADTPEPDGRLDGRTLIWQLDHMTPNEANILIFSVTADQDDVWIANQASVIYRTYTSGASDGALLPITGLLPNTPAPPDWQNTRTEIIAAFNRHSELIDLYKRASAQTGMPWQIIAGLHFVETGGGPGPDSSPVSGRKIGQVEPDISPSKCASGVSGPGIPVPIGSGCGFSNQLDSIIYAANHLAEKVGKVPSTFNAAVTALSRYNGGGNANCGEGLPYQPCPPEFEGQDDPYAMADFDAAHSSDTMYLIFCSDGVKCSPPRVFGRPGAMGIVRALSEEGL